MRLVSISIILPVAAAICGTGKLFDQPEREIERGGHRAAAQDVVLLGQYFGHPQIDFG